MRKAQLARGLADWELEKEAGRRMPPVSTDERGFGP